MSKHARRTPEERDAVLRAYPTVDSAIHAYVLGMNERNVRARQRQLGVRKCVSYIRKAERPTI